MTELAPDVWVDLWVAPLVRSARRHDLETTYSCQGYVDANGDTDVPAYVAFAPTATPGQVMDWLLALPVPLGVRFRQLHGDDAIHHRPERRGVVELTDWTRMTGGVMTRSTAVHMTADTCDALVLELRKLELMFELMLARWLTTSGAPQRALEDAATMRLISGEHWRAMETAAAAYRSRP